MARKFYGSIDLSDNELLNYRGQMLPSDPSPLEAKSYYNTTAKEFRYHNGTAWVPYGTGSAGGAAGGDLSGTYPNPQIAAGVIVDADVNAANKDGAAATPSMRTLGTGAQQAARGDHNHLTAITDWNSAQAQGWYYNTTSSATNQPEAGFFTGEVSWNNSPPGGAELTQTIWGTADTPTDSHTWRRHRINTIWGSWYRLRLTQAEQDARYQVAGGAAGGDLSGTYPNPQIAAGVIVDADVNAANKDGAAATPSMRTLGTGANQAAPGNDSRFTDSRPPTGAASGDLSGTYPSPQIAAGVIVDGDVNASAAIAQSKIANLTTDLAARVLKAGDTMGGFLTLSADPTAALHAATKQYVDLATQGFSFKSACRVVATTNQVLTGLLTIDGVTLVANDRVLLAGQTSAAENGIWVAASGAWARANDMNATGELVDGTLVPIGSGTLNSDSQFMCISIAATPWVPGTTGSAWTKWSSLNELVAGAGLTKAGTGIDFVGGPTLQVLADIVHVLSAPKWSAPITLSLTGDVTGSASIDGSAAVNIATTGGGKRYAAALTASTSQVVTHNLNTRDVIVQVYNTAANFEEIEVEVQRTSVNTVTIIATPALPAGYRVVVLA